MGITPEEALRNRVDMIYALHEKIQEQNATIASLRADNDALREITERQSAAIAEIRKALDRDCEGIECPPLNEAPSCLECSENRIQAALEAAKGE